MIIYLDSLDITLVKGEDFGLIVKTGKWKKLKPHLNKMWNRYQCTLRDSRGIRKLCKISRLVATVYLPNPENLHIVMHLDNNPANDYYRNLKWGTQKENIKQCLSDGRLLKTKSSYLVNKSQIQLEIP